MAMMTSLPQLFLYDTTYESDKDILHINFPLCKIRRSQLTIMQLQVSSSSGFFPKGFQTFFEQIRSSEILEFQSLKA